MPMILDNLNAFLVCSVITFVVLVVRLFLHRSWLRRWAEQLDDLLHVHQHLKVPQLNDSTQQENPFYRRVSLYLDSLPSLPDADYINLLSGRTPNDIVLSPDDDQIIRDAFLGSRLSWLNSIDRDVRNNVVSRCFVLKIKKKDKRRILKPYFQHIHAVSDDVEERGRELSIHSNCGGTWKSVPFDHPANFESLVIGHDLKSRIQLELEMFARSKQFHHKLGWVIDRAISIKISHPKKMNFSTSASFNYEHNEEPNLGMAADTTEIFMVAGESFLSSVSSFNQQKQKHDPNQALNRSEIFSLSGPSFLTAVDWNNSHHRRSVAASLVQGVYCLESDRRQHRQGPQALAPPWHQFFDFKLVQPLIDKQDGSYFGAIYEHAPDDGDQKPGQEQEPKQKPPHYVIAFRGTINTKGNREQDHRLNLQLIINNLENSPRFQVGLDCTSRFVQAGPGNVWLAGHALGSSLALLLGKKMVRSGIHLETYLFNPPFASPHIERIKNENLKRGLRFANSVLTAGIAAAVSPKKKDKGVDPFAALAAWVPYLFINSSDPICSEYVGYFKHREDMEGMGETARKIGRLATKHSVREIFAVARGKTDSEAVHLIPSAYLTVNAAASQNYREAHAIHQWWRLDLPFHYKYYQYKS